MPESENVTGRQGQGRTVSIETRKQGEKLEKGMLLVLNKKKENAEKCR